MTSSIPKVALVLALFGVVPFAWGAITSVSADAFNFGMDIFEFVCSLTTQNHTDIQITQKKEHLKHTDME